MIASHPLDCAVWSALTTRQAHLATGLGGVLRFDPAYALFAATQPDVDYTDENWADLARTTGRIALFECDPAVPKGLVEVDRINCQQMVCEALNAGGPKLEFEDLIDADGPEMLALATLTRPGPFLAKTHCLGPFIGIREHGRLIAMAGERLNLDGFGEVSGVCTHPDFRGRGYAGALMRVVAKRILERGDTPFLHARIGHAATIAFYETLGFRCRSTPSYVVMEPGPVV